MGLISQDDFLEIVDLNNYLWENYLTTRSVSKWFANFDGQSSGNEAEQETALNLIKKFLYYNEKEIRYLCKSAFSLLKRHAIVQNANQLFTQAGERQVQTFMDNCLFSYVGRAGESGAMLSCPFRQENDIPVRRCMEPAAFLTNEITDGQLANSNLIFLDDFVGTGTQVNEFWDTRVAQIKNRCANVKIHWLALVATKRATENILQHTNIPIICPQILDESYQAFNALSKIFPDPQKRETAKSVCKYYGERLVGNEDALGYKDSQVLLGFHHNIPDNTLPVIWAETEIENKKWQPLFKRRVKLY